MMDPTEALGNDLPQKVTIRGHGEAWLASRDEVARVASHLLSSCTRSPTEDYLFPVEWVGSLRANEARLANYLCWKAQACGGTALIDSREALVFGRLGKRFSVEFRRLALTKVSGVPAFADAGEYRRGERSGYRVMLPWLRGPRLTNVYAKPGGLLWHRWLALFPGQMIPLRMLDLALQAAGGRIELARLRGACRRVYADGPASERISPRSRDIALALLYGIRLMHRVSQDGRAFIELDRAALDAPPSHAHFSPEALTFLGRSLESRSVLEVGNPAASSAQV